MKHITLIVLLLISPLLQASDIAKEKRWAEQTVDSIMDGEASWLMAGKHKFLAIYTESSEPSDKAVIIMHGIGVHPNWPQVVLPLRVGLTEHGWNTISIQMPILPNDAEHNAYAPLFDEVPARVDAAIAFLKQKGSRSIYLVGHSLGSAMGAYYLSSHPGDIRGFVAIGMQVNEHDPRMNTSLTLSKIQIPSLDLYGTKDLPEVMKSVDKRKAAAASAGNKDYQQKMIEGDHFFEGHEQALTDTVAEWLNSH